MRKSIMNLMVTLMLALIAQLVTPITAQAGGSRYLTRVAYGGGTIGPKITSAAPNIVTGTLISYKPTIAGGQTPYACSISTLPAGLTFNAATCTVSGTPTVATSFTITVADKSGASTAQALGPRPAPTNLQLVANMTAVPNNAVVALGAFARAPGRNAHISAPVAATSIRFVDVAFSIFTSAETALPNGFTVQRAIEIGSTTTRALYSGANVGTVNAPSGGTGGLIISDPIAGVTLPAATTFWSRREDNVATSTDVLPNINLNSADSQGFRTNLASEVTGVGALNASGSTGSPVRWPAMIVGVPASPIMSLIAVVDSIGTRLNDTNTATTQGFITRAALNVGGVSIPLHKQGVQGSMLIRQSPSTAPLSKQLWPYATDILIQVGTNDLAALTTGTTGEILATMQARFADLANYARSVTGPYGKRLRVHATSILDRSDFSATQRAVRTSYNAWLAAGAGGLLDKYHDIDAAGGSYSGYSDGVHPTSTDHANMGAVLAAGLVPYLDPYYGL